MSRSRVSGTLVITVVLLASFAVPAAAPPRPILFDGDGDRLPPGAVMRIGSTRLRHPGGSVQSLAYSPDGRFLASGSCDTIALWEPSTGRRLCCLSIDNQPDRQLLFSADSTALIQGRGKVVGFWEVVTGKLLRRLPVREEVYSVALSPDGKLLATGGAGDPYRVWDVFTGKEIARLPWKGEWFGGMAWVPGTTKLAVLGRGRRKGFLFTLWDVRSGKQTRMRLDGTPHVPPSSACFAFSPDGKLLAVGDSKGRIKLRHPETGKVVGQLEGHRAEVQHVHFSPDGRTLASVGWDDLIRLWDVATRKQTAHFPSGGDVCPAFSPDSKTLATPGDKGIHFWDVATGKEKLPRQQRDSVGRPLGFAADGKTLFEWYGRQVRAWDLRARIPRPTRTPLTGVTPGFGGLSPDGKVLAVLPWDQTVELWDTATGKRRAAFAPPREDEGRHRLLTIQAYQPSCFSPDGKTLAVANAYEAITLYDLTSGKRRFTFRSRWLRPRSLALSPDGKTLAGTDENSVVLWDLARRDVARRLENNPHVSAVGYSPDGRTLAAMNEDGVRLWDSETWKVRKDLPLKGLAGAHRMAFSPSGDTLAVAGDGLLLFDIPTGRRRAHLREASGGVGEPIFSSDGGRIAAWTNDGTILIWDVSALRGGRCR